MIVEEKRSLISVVVPVYNVEKYLKKCYETIIHQSYQNLEILLINDGSKDSSGSMCDELAELDKRVKVIHKENAGLGMARNTGIENASGEYIVFVDSDDFLHENMIEKLYEELVRTNSDTSYCGYMEYYEDGICKDKPAFYDHVQFEGMQIIDNVLLEMIAARPSEKNEALLSMSVWHAIYSMELIQKFHLRFPSEREYISEDIIFDIAYLQKSKKVCYISDMLYFYRCDNAASLTHKYSDNEFQRHKKVVNKLNEELGKFLREEDYIERTQRYLLGRLRTCIQKAITYKRFNKEFDLNRQLKKLVNDKDVRKTIAQYPYKKNTIQLRIFNFFVHCKIYTVIKLLIQIKGMTRRNRF